MNWHWLKHEWGQWEHVATTDHYDMSWGDPGFYDRTTYLNRRRCLVCGKIEHQTETVKK